MLLHRDLPNAVFPWVEGEIEALEERCASNRFAINIALLLIWLRRVLYKVAAVIYRIISIFNTPSFRAFAASAASQIGKLRKKGLVLHLRAFQKTLPPTVRNAVAVLSLEQKRECEANKFHRDKMLAQIEYLTELAATGSAVSL
jgi:hypothetical protein